LLKEIEDTEATNSNIEDEMLECLDRVDVLESSVAAKKSEYAAVADQIRNDKENIEKETEKGRKRIAELENNRKEVTGKIEPELLAKFNLIKGQQSGGIAIVPVVDAVCNGCNVNLPPQMHNELQRFDSLRFCPNCQRIVYWKDC
jgi:predicted  nucleic acid-binding Zn-ribbon protein